MRNPVLFFGLLLMAGSIWADESQIHLKPGANMGLVASNCAVCHSTDYIQMNSTFMDRKGWQGEVDKMVNVMHAPINKEDVPKIVDYLTKHYGTGG